MQSLSHLNLSNFEKSISLPSKFTTQTSARRFLHRFFNHRFGEIHHSVHVHIGAVKFEHREFGIVLVRQAFVAEIAVEFVNLFKTADDEAFQIKFGRDSGVKRNVESFVMSFKRFAAAPVAFGVSIGVSTSM